MGARSDDSLRFWTLAAGLAIVAGFVPAIFSTASSLLGFEGQLVRHSTARIR
jgi:hypothetical protein